MPVNEFIEHVGEIPEGRRGTPFSGDGNRVYQRQFRVITRNRHFSTLMATTAPGLPSYFTPYVVGPTEAPLEYDLLPLHTRREAENDPKHWNVWVVTCYYETVMPPGGPPSSYGGEGPQGGGGGSANNPELEPRKISCGTESIVQAPLVDLDEKPYVNAAGQPFSPAPTFDFKAIVVTVSINQLTYSEFNAALYENAVNSDSPFGYPPGTVQVVSISAESEYRGSLFYWRATYKLRFSAIWDKDPGTELYVLRKWQPRFLNAGTMKKVFKPALNDFELQHIDDPRTNVPITDPIPLDIFGTGPAPRDENGNYIPNYITRRQYRDVPLIPLILNGVR